MSSQFPPSSPLRDEKESNDPFVFKPKPDAFVRPETYERGRIFNYPTPHPSSSTGRSSSPHYQSDNDFEEPRKVAFQVTKPVMPGALNGPFNITKVPLFQPIITVGRSSKSSDVTIKTNDRNVSRKHIKITQLEDEIVIECLGCNGFGMTVPRACRVAVLCENQYKLTPIETQLSAQALKKLSLSSTIKLNSNSTEFLVKKGESVTLPRLVNVILEIKNSVILVNPRLDSEETEDEMPVMANRLNVTSLPVKQVIEHVKPADTTVPISFVEKAKQTNLVEAKPETEAEPAEVVKETQVTETAVGSKPTETIEAEPKQVSSEPAQAKQPEQVEAQPAETRESKETDISLITPGRLPVSLPMTPNKKLFRITSEESTPVKKQKTLPLSDKTNTYNSKKFKKAKSEEPRKLKSEPQEPEIRLEDIQDLPEINNILTNHLAFSRLASTPKSILRNISEKINDLTDSQMKLILNAIPSVGVIYREGKDAAGKPLDEEYYYIPEQDENQERTQLVASLKGHGGIRSCRRTHKQYYWKKPAPIKSKGKN